MNKKEIRCRSIASMTNIFVETWLIYMRNIGFHMSQVSKYRATKVD